MTTMTRRDAMKVGAAALAVAAMPVAAQAVLPASPALPGWVLGTAGEYDWQFVRAATEAEARLAYALEVVGNDECDTGDAPSPECECEVCYVAFGVEAERATKMDHITGDPTPGDWIRAGLGYICDRCSYETSAESDGHAVGDEAVCEECMTLTDWDVVDPERAAEIRAEEADEIGR